MDPRPFADPGRIHMELINGTLCVAAVQRLLGFCAGTFTIEHSRSFGCC